MWTVNVVRYQILTEIASGDLISCVAERHWKEKRVRKAYYSIINNAEHFPSWNLTTNSWKSSPDNSCRKGSCAALFFIIHRAMLVGILYLLCGKHYFHTRGTQSQSGLHRAPLLTQDALRGVWFSVLIAGKTDPADLFSNHWLQTHICLLYFASLQLFTVFFLLSIELSGQAN